MQHDKTQVFDIEQHAAPEPVDPVTDTIMAVVRTQMDADRWFAQALWYAYGRLVHEEAVVLDLDGQPAVEATAWGFGRLYQQMMLDFRDRKRSDTIAMATAWDTYRGSAGGTVG